MRIAVIVILLSALAALLQDYQPPADRLPTEFYFVRLEYAGFHDDTYIKNWYTDYPEADRNFAVIANRLTNIRTAATKVNIDTGNIFRYPFIYIVEPAQANLTYTNIARLREYTARGGFLLLDDIHGDEDMLPVRELLHRIFGDADYLYTLDTSHEVFHSFFDIASIVQVVNDGIAMCAACTQFENGESGRIPQVLAHYGNSGNMDMLVLYNNDVGDAAEWLDDPKYPREMSVWGAKMLVNVAVFVLTH